MKEATVPVLRSIAGTVLAVSPHLDDAVFSCGRLLAHLSHLCCAERMGRVIVATVFAGRPVCDTPMTEWDRAGGFAQGDDVVTARREEDRNALQRLGARHVWLPFADSQYGASPSVRRIAAALHRLFLKERPTLVLFPLGLFHSDHRLVRDAVLLWKCHQRRRREDRSRLMAFEDALYRRIPGALRAAVAHLRQRGWRLQGSVFVGSSWADHRKRAAVACYGSQLKALATPGRLGHEDAFASEGYWRFISGRTG